MKSVAVPGAVFSASQAQLGHIVTPFQTMRDVIEVSWVSADRSVELSARVCAELEVITGGIMFGTAEPEEVDIHESLVDLGFDSMTLLDLLEKINKRFSIEIDLLAIIDYPSLAQLASYITERHAAELASALNTAAADGKDTRL